MPPVGSKIKVPGAKPSDVSGVDALILSAKARLEEWAKKSKTGTGNTKAPTGIAKAQPTLSKEEVIKIQQDLNKKGFNLKVDGIMGSLTRDAMRVNEARTSSKNPITSAVRAGTKGIVPTNLRIFAESLTGSDQTVTEDDLTKLEFNKLQELVRANLKKGKKTITYSDYANSENVHGASHTSAAMIKNTKSNPEYNLRTMLGAARIATIGRDTFVLDRYNFNDAPIGKRSFGERLAGLALDPSGTGAAGEAYNLTRSIGKHFGPNEEEGMQVAIRTNEKGKAQRPTPAIAQESTFVANKTRPGLSLKMNGGQIGSAVGMAANLAAPGVGSVIAPLLSEVGTVIEQKLSNNKLPLNTNSNPYGYALGGQLQNSGLGSGMALYKGRQHKTGGIMVMPSGVPSPKREQSNVEGGEVLVQLGKLGNHIFSKKLKVQ